MLNDNERKHLNWMREQIIAYETGASELGALIAGLESLVGTMESLAPKDREDFVRHWGELEQVYAVALDREMQELDCVGQQIVNEGIGKLKGWIDGVGAEA
jgi:hypothetical protein